VRSAALGAFLGSAPDWELDHLLMSCRQVTSDALQEMIRQRPQAAPVEELKRPRLRAIGIEEVQRSPLSVSCKTG